MTSIVGASLLVATTVLPVAADGPTNYGDWGAPTAVAAANTAAHHGCPIESPNGKKLYVASTRPGGFGKNDIWVAERQNKNAPWGLMTNLGPATQQRRPGILAHAARRRLPALRLGSCSLRCDSPPDAPRWGHVPHPPAS